MELKSGADLNEIDQYHLLRCHYSLLFSLFVYT